MQNLVRELLTKLGEDPNRDTPLFGHTQPPVLASEVQRKKQATVLRQFIDALYAADPNVNIVSVGDYNDFEWSPPLQILLGSGPTAMHDLMA